MSKTRLGLSATSSKRYSFASKSKGSGSFSTLGSDGTPRAPQEFTEKDGSSNYLGGYYHLLKYLSKRG